MQRVVELHFWCDAIVVNEPRQMAKRRRRRGGQSNGEQQEEGGGGGAKCLVTIVAQLLGYGDGRLAWHTMCTPSYGYLHNVHL